jgi:predicted dehydrogenase
MFSNLKSFTRREFLSDSGQAVAGVIAGNALFSAISAAPAISANLAAASDRINLAIIGIRSRGMALADTFAKIENVRIKTLVDIDENFFAERVSGIEKAHGYKPGAEYDMRRAFDDKDIDAIVIATPNHWHALATIWACQAGKHVYVEKPCSHNVWEGRQMVAAARKHNCLVQVGCQNRSRKNTMAAMKFLHDGQLGKIHMARGLCFKPRNDIGRYPEGPLAAGEKFSMTVGSDYYEPAYTAEYLQKVHYDLWLGPAPERPFNRNRFHYNWHWHWDYGNGDTGNQGPHQFDIARWGLNKDDYPVKIKSFGGMFVFNSSQETPNTQTSIFEYADGTIFEFATRGLMTNPEGEFTKAEMMLAADGKWKTSRSGALTIGNLFYGSEGWMQIDSEGNWQTFFGRNNEPGPSSAAIKDEKYDPMNLAGSGEIDHCRNFIAALRSGKREELTCDIAAGHLSSALPHLANISFRLGRELTFDGKREKFANDAEANRLLTREYRKPFVVPEKV